MASLSPKGNDLKKGTQKVLSPSNGTADKSLKSPLKSPTSKLNPKSPILKANDIGKNNLGIRSKMDSNSPPKMARTPSSKSMSPPNKTPFKSPPNVAGKPGLDKSNSQGDIVVSSELKNGVGVVPLETASNEVTNVAEAKPELASNGETTAAPVAEHNEPEQDKEPKDEPISNGSVASTLTNGDACSDNVCKMDPAKATKSEQIYDEQIAISEQKHASGDSAPAINDKIEHKDSAGEGFVAEKPEKLENYENFTQHLPSSGVTLTVVSNREKIVDKSDDSKNEETVDEKPTESEQPKVVEKPIADGTGASSTPKGSPDTTASDVANCSAETAKLVDEPTVAGEPTADAAAVETEVSKQSFRLQVWDNLEKNDLVLFPRPCKGRIPNFKGAHQAAEKLSSTKVFKSCKTIKVNPDKAQEMVRFHTLEHGKRLLVPIPRLREGLFQAVVPPTDASKYQLQQASQRYGMKKWSKPVSLDDKVTIDMVVLGSVAVDKKGHRIGKGEGFADLEFAMLVKMNAVNENTVIVTTVHDDQVFDELPDDLFKEHDVPVDWIVTPTQIIEVTEPLARPKEIIWSILSNRRILEIPILQKLREQEISEGSECTLKEVDSDVEEKIYPQESVFNKRFTRRRRYNYSRSTGDPIRDSKLETQAPVPYYNNRPRRYSPPQNRVNYNDGRRYDGPPPQRRNYYQAPYAMNRPMRQGRPRSMNRSGPPPPAMNQPRNMNRNDRPQSDPRVPSNRPRSGNRQRSDNHQQSNNRQANNATTKSVEVQTVDKNVRTSRPFIKRKRAPIEFSLRVKNIGTGVRVRDLKIALNERGIKPRDITWRGYRGFAFLHFVKSASKENEPLAVEDVMNALEGLPLPPKSKKALVIEPAKPKKSSDDGSADSKEDAIDDTTIIIKTVATVNPTPVVAV